MAEINLTEHEEAILFAKYLETLQVTGRIELFSHVPQETFTKNWGTKMRNKKEGVRMGVPDYIIVTADKVLFVELKRVKGSKTTPEQLAWIAALQGKNTKATVAKGFDEAVEFVTRNI